MNTEPPFSSHPPHVSAPPRSTEATISGKRPDDPSPRTSENDAEHRASGLGGTRAKVRRCSVGLGGGGVGWGLGIWRWNILDYSSFSSRTWHRGSPESGAARRLRSIRAHFRVISLGLQFPALSPWEYLPPDSSACNISAKLPNSVFQDSAWHLGRLPFARGHPASPPHTRDGR